MARWLLAGSLALIVGLLVPGGAARSVTSGVAPTDCYNTDNGDPVLTDLTIEPTSVDVSDGPAIVTFTIRARDTGGPGPKTGIRRVLLSLGAPGQPFYNVNMNAAKDASGAWIAQGRIPQGATAGQWDVGTLYLIDAGYGVSLHFGGPFGDLAGMGFDDHVDVTSVPDTAAPTLDGFTASPKSVNTTGGSQTVTVSAVASDADSGVTGVSVHASAPDGLHQASATLELGAGTNHDGIWSGTLRIPRWAGTGTWKIDSVTVEDEFYYNTKSLGYDELGVAGFDRDLDVTSLADTTKPRLTGFTRTPRSVDVRIRNQQVDLAVVARDATSGVASVRVQFRSDYGFTVAANLKRVSGTAAVGTWTGSTQVRRCYAETGDWDARVTVTDRAGNQRVYTVRDLRARDLPRTLAVLSKDRIWPSAERASEFVPEAGPLTVNFSEAVTGIRPATAPVVALDPTASSTTPVNGTWACTNRSDSATPCRTGHVWRATFTPTDVWTGYIAFNVVLNPEGTLGITDFGGNAFAQTIVQFLIG